MVKGNSTLSQSEDIGVRPKLKESNEGGNGANEEKQMEQPFRPQRPKERGPKERGPRGRSKQRIGYVRQD